MLNGFIRYHLSNYTLKDIYTNSKKNINGTYDRLNNSYICKKDMKTCYYLPLKTPLNISTNIARP